MARKLLIFRAETKQTVRQFVHILWNTLQVSEYVSLNRQMWNLV